MTTGSYLTNRSTPQVLTHDRLLQRVWAPDPRRSGLLARPALPRHNGAVGVHDLPRHRSGEQVAGDANEELTTKPEAISVPSNTAIWQLRHPIDMDRVFDGGELEVQLTGRLSGRSHRPSRLVLLSPGRRNRVLRCRLSTAPVFWRTPPTAGRCWAA